MVSARLAKFKAGIAHSGSFGSSTPADFVDDSTNVGRRISTAHYAHHKVHLYTGAHRHSFAVNLDLSFLLVLCII